MLPGSFASIAPPPGREFAKQVKVGSFCPSTSSRMTGGGCRGGRCGLSWLWGCVGCRGGVEDGSENILYIYPKRRASRRGVVVVRRNDWCRKWWRSSSSSRIMISSSSSSSSRCTSGEVSGGGRRIIGSGRRHDDGRQRRSSSSHRSG